MKQTLRFALVSVIGALSACHSLEPFPGNAAVASWQKQFRALDCRNPRYLHDMPSTEPLRFAMVGVCDHTPIQRQNSGWETLVTIDARHDRVTAIPIASIYTGGVHFTNDGDVVWYSSGKGDEAARTQNYAEAYRLRQGEAKERLLGRIDLPFVLGPGIGYFAGEGCHLVVFGSFLADEKSPRLQRFFLVDDREPFESAKPLDGVGRGLFWDPVRHYFVVQTAPYREVGLPKDQPLERHAVDCSGRMREIDGELGARLALITDENALYRMSSKGDLIVSGEKPGGTEPEVIVFHGDQVSRINSAPSYALCPDLACEPSYGWLFAGPWSGSGEYFMIDRGFARVEVYRARDMRMVHRWQMEDAGDFPAHGFINDNVAYQLNDHSRMTFQTW